MALDRAASWNRKGTSRPPTSCWWILRTISLRVFGSKSAGEGECGCSFVVVTSCPTRRPIKRQPAEDLKRWPRNYKKKICVKENFGYSSDISKFLGNIVAFEILKMMENVSIQIVFYKYLHAFMILIRM